MTLGFTDLIGELYRLRDQYGADHVSATMALPSGRRLTLEVDRLGSRAIDQDGAMLDINAAAGDGSS